MNISELNHRGVIDDLRAITAKAMVSMVHVRSWDGSATACLLLTVTETRHLADILNRAADEAERSGWRATENGGNHDEGESA